MRLSKTMIEALGEAATGLFGWAWGFPAPTVQALRRRGLIETPPGGGYPIISTKGRAWYDGYRQGRADGKAGL